MRSILFFVTVILISLSSQAQTVIAEATTKTVGGISGYSDVFQTFKPGDKINIHARANKLLALVTISQSNNRMLGKIKETRTVDYTFTVPSEDSVKFHFVTDRAGSTSINYKITKLN